MIESSVRSHSIAVRSSQFRILEFLLIIEFFISMNAYFFWSIHPMAHFILYVLISLIGYSYFLSKGYKLTSKAIIATFFYLLAYFWGTRLNVIGIISVLFPVLMVAPLLLFFRKEESEDLLHKISVVFAAIVALGVIEYLVSLVVPLPSFGKLKYVGIAELEFEYFNYIFMVQQDSYSVVDYQRFASIFTEPGHLAVVSCFLLYGNKYDFKKWYNIVLLVGTIVSLSLAGYLLIMMSMFFLSTGKNSKKLLIALIVLVATGTLFGIYYNGGDNVINERIFERLQYDEEKGISGNNRVSDNTELLFLAAVANGDIIRGYGAEFDDYVDAGYHGAGWQFFLLRKGVIGLIFAVFFYLFMTFDSKNRKYALGLLAIYSAAFLDQADVFNFAWSVIFVCAYKTAPVAERKRLRVTPSHLQKIPESDCEAPSI